MEEKAVLWNLPARLLHWGVASCIVAVFFLEGGDPPHNWVGYVAAGMVIFRLVYGINKHFHRENVLARIVYVLIWVIVLALAITGWMYGLDKFWGEEWLHELHVNLSDALLWLVGLHLAGIIKDAVTYKRKTWMGMITGHR